MIYDDEGFAAKTLKKADRCIDAVVGTTTVLTTEEIKSLDCENQKTYLQEMGFIQQEVDDDISKYGVLGATILGCGIAIETITQLSESSGDEYIMGVASVVSLGVASYGALRTAIKGTRKSNEVANQYRGVLDKDGSL